MKLTPIENRFWDKVNKTDTCWLWTGSTSDGYGMISGPQRKNLKAHRVSLGLIGINIPHGMVVDHICRVRNCVNPAHLRVVDRDTNLFENSIAIPAINKNKTHCVRGHLFDASNTYHSLNDKKNRPRRKCRACRNISVKKHRRINGHATSVLSSEDEQIALG